MSRAFLGLALALLLIAPLPANAQQYWKKSDLMVSMFPASLEVVPVLLTLDVVDVAAFQAQLGYAPKATTYTFYQARTAGKIDGYVLFDDELGQHEPITFAVQFDPTGVVLRSEVVVYREKYGAEVRSPRFASQFIGKSASDPLVAGKDVKIISGATYSSKAMARGVKRAAVLARLLIEANPPA